MRKSASSLPSYIALTILTLLLFRPTCAHADPLRLFLAPPETMSLHARSTDGSPQAAQPTDQRQLLFLRSVRIRYRIERVARTLKLSVSFENSSAFSRTISFTGFVEQKTGRRLVTESIPTPIVLPANGHVAALAKISGASETEDITGILELRSEDVADGGAAIEYAHLNVRFPGDD